MRLKFPILAMVATVAVGASAATPAAGDIASALDRLDCYAATVSYTVTLPQADDDVRYSVGLEALRAEADTLSPVDYVIDWTFRAASGAAVSGFSAYYGGHHYRFRGDRLQEYHVDWDPAPFLATHRGGRTCPGVQRGVQFANLLPAFIAADIRDMEADSLYALAVSPAGPDRVKLKAVMAVAGQECLETTYTFMLPSMLPLSIDTETNVGTISEQSLRALYVYPDASAPCPPAVTEEALAARWPDAFERMRESNFRIENLPGQPLPTFSLPVPDGGARLTHQRGEAFGVPVLLVLLDPDKGFAAETVAAVRRGVDGLAYEPEVIWALAANRAGAAGEILGTLRSGESSALRAASLARDCGAASLPVIIMCDSSGRVADVVLGFNNDLGSIVMQKMSLLK